jgi:pSer/pThr/pTyr-binding forkhead associated (FHA) protein
VQPLTVETGVIIGMGGMFRSALIPIKAGECLVFGRDATMAHIVVDSDAENVSRRHCSVSFDSARGGFTVTDHSRNGTFLNSRRLKNGVATPAALGSVLSLGDDRNSFLLGEPPTLTLR